ncbi:MAG: ABC transporter ATP-binding protein [Thermoprotei archaeon]
MLLEIKELSVVYKTIYGRLEALNKVSLSLPKATSISIVGESGSGKSTLGLACVRLLPLNAEYSHGSVVLDGQDITKMSASEARKVRGTGAFMVFQDPLNTLNPVKRISTQLLEAIRVRDQRLDKTFDEKVAYNEAITQLREVRVGDPELLIERYPFQLSGGQIQRVVIAMGLLMRPKLLIADEPTSALDVTVQAQVLKLIQDLKQSYDMSVLFITHDMSVAYNVADKMMVMYAGELSEIGSADDVIKSPSHPYAKALIASIPTAIGRTSQLVSIRGSPPNMLNPPSGCRFHPRCPSVMPVCSRESPREVQVNGKVVRCFLYG